MNTYVIDIGYLFISNVFKYTLSSVEQAFALSCLQQPRIMLYLFYVINSNGRENLLYPLKAMDLYLHNQSVHTRKNRWNFKGNSLLKLSV